MGEKKSRILYIKRFLEEHTDENHPATIADIMEYLSGEGIPSNRKTLAQDIDQLIESGVDVICTKSRQNQYFVGIRHFETPELKLLLDAAQASRFLTTTRSRALTKKLLSLTNRYQATDLSSGLFLDIQPRPISETAYIAADILLTAINRQHRVRFMYYEYGPDKKRIYKHGRRIYELSPWAFVWNNDSYYIIGHSKTHDKDATFRVDRIAAPKLTDKQAIPAPEDFNLADYVQSVFQMYDGPTLDVTLKCANDFMKTIIDRFGEDVQTGIADTEHFYAKVRVSASKTFYGWVFGMDGAIQITAPTEAVEAYRAMLNSAKSLQ